MIRDLTEPFNYDGVLKRIDIACDEEDTTPTEKRPVTGIVTGSTCWVINSTPPRIDAFSEESGAWVPQVELGT